MKKPLIFLTIFLLSTSVIRADEGHESVFGVSPANFTIEKGQPGQEEETESIMDNDLDVDLVFDLKLSRLDGETEIPVDLTGDVMELSFEDLINKQIVAKANSETTLNFTIIIAEDAPDGTFIYYLDLIEVTEGEQMLDGDIFMTFEIEVEDPTVAEVDGSFSLDINSAPLLIGGCILPIVIIVVVVVISRKKKRKSTEK